MHLAFTAFHSPHPFHIHLYFYMSLTLCRFLNRKGSLPLFHLLLCGGHSHYRYFGSSMPWFAKATCLLQSVGDTASHHSNTSLMPLANTCQDLIRWSSFLIKTHDLPYQSVIPTFYMIFPPLFEWVLFSLFF